MPKIRHLAFFTDSPEDLAKFYTEVIGFEIKGRGKQSVWITDGYMDIALLKRTDDSHVHRGLNHFGITVEDDAEKEAICKRLEAIGRPAVKPPLDRSYVEDYAKDVDGNKFDLSTSAVQVRKEGQRSVFKNPSEKVAAEE
jgi:catechol 2,3-dioxygenase-like lactoylglutathione lyase family enzyme